MFTFGKHSTATFTPSRLLSVHRISIAQSHAQSEAEEALRELLKIYFFALRNFKISVQVYLIGRWQLTVLKLLT